MCILWEEILRKTVGSSRRRELLKCYFVYFVQKAMLTPLAPGIVLSRVN